MIDEYLGYFLACAGLGVIALAFLGGVWAGRG